MNQMNKIYLVKSKSLPNWSCIGVFVLVEKVIRTYFLKNTCFSSKRYFIWFLIGEGKENWWEVEIGKDHIIGNAKVMLDFSH